MANDNEQLEPISEPYYRVTITRVEERRTVRRDWVQIYNDADRPQRDQYAYRTKPAIERVEREILKQEISDLDVKTVVLAVLGLAVEQQPPFRPRGG